MAFNYTSQQVEGLLSQLMVANNEVIKAAETELKKMLKNPVSSLALLEQVKTSSLPQVRQMAAVVLRKKITTHWSKLNIDQQNQVKKVLLECLVQEQHGLVRNSITNVVSAVARYTVPSGQWNELLQFLYQSSQSDTPAYRETAMVLFYALTETVGSSLKPHFPTLMNIFTQGLQDPSSPNIRGYSLKAVGGTLQWIDSEEEVKMFQALIPSMLNVAKQCLDNDQDEIAIAAFGVFDDLVEMPVPLINSSLPVLLTFMLEVASKPDYSLNVRERAMNFVEWTITYKPKTLIKTNLLPSILQVVFNLLSESDEDVDDVNEVSTVKFAAHVLEEISMSISADLVFNPIMSYCSQLMSSTNPFQRRAAVVALAVISEGCSENLIETLDQLLPAVLAAFKDQHNKVREAACIAMTQFAEYMQPEIIDHYQTVLPCLFMSLDDPSDDVKEKVCYSIESFVENLGDKILPFLDHLMQKLFGMLQNGTSRKVQEIVIPAISSAATAAGPAFLPYFEHVRQMASVLMKQNGDTELVLRARATECIGVVASAVGLEKFSPYVQEFMQLALDGFALDFNEIREYTFGFFSNLAELLGQAFHVYLPVVMEHVLRSCSSNDGEIKREVQDAELFSAKGGEQFEDEDDEDEDDYGRTSLSVRTSFLDEKASATHCIGILAKSCKNGFLPFIEKSMSTLVDLYTYFHADVRRNVVYSLKHLTKCLYESFPNSPNDINEHARKALETVILTYIHIIDDDEDKDVVGAVFEMLGEIAKEMGPSALAAHLERIINSVINLYRQQAPCQQLYDEEDEAEDEDEEDIEETVDTSEQAKLLLDIVCECVDDFSKVYGQAFTPFFARLLPDLLKFTKADGSVKERIMAIGTLAGIADGLKEHFNPYVKLVYPIALQGLDEKDQNIVRNSAFCTGVLILNNPEESMQFVGHTLQSLHKLFVGTKYDGAVVDNACGAVCRMLMSRIADKIPLQNVLPILIGALPLKEDFEENQTVYNCLFTLIQSGNSIVTPHIPAIVNIFASVLGSPDLDSTLQAQMITILQQMRTQPWFGQVVESLQPQKRDNLQTYLSQ